MLPMSGYKYDSLKPLIESQGIEIDLNANTPSIDYDMSGWRECYEDHISLLDAQARYLNIVSRNDGHMDVSKPWINVDADENGYGRVIFNRSHRYRNDKFPWKAVHKHFCSRALFIGTEHEHSDFCKEIGNVEYYKTNSCLDVAKVIHAADFFVGNQSSAFWIAAALHKKLLQETFPPAPNSIVSYPGAWYCSDGIVNFDELEK